ncbi:MAG TPA: response regulator [Longimicrobiales bacterium]|nr:response regulator [Longimicrobiales bacterium]
MFPPSHPNGQDKPVILVAEDHLDSREALSALLQAFGFAVIEAVDGREAVDLARRTRPDLILMDLMMPELDGFEAMRMIRASSDTKETPIITLTALKGARQLALDAGADDFISKPIDSGRLVEKLRTLLDARA